MRQLEQGDQITGGRPHGGEARIRGYPRRKTIRIGLRTARWPSGAWNRTAMPKGWPKPSMTVSNAEGCQVDEVTRVSRETAGDVWAFPASLAGLNKPLGVLIIHWWTITGSTLLHLVRLAANSGASWIAAVCVLNQMGDANEADVLRMLRAVSAPSATADDRTRVGRPIPPGTAPVPVSIRFVATSGISAFNPHDCPMCARVSAIDSTKRRTAAPAAQARGTAAGHAEAAGPGRGGTRLGGRPVHRAGRRPMRPPTTCAGVGLLLQARRTVRDRQKVIDRLRALTGEHPPAARMDQRRADPTARRGAALAAAPAAALPGRHRPAVTDLREESSSS